MRRRGGPGARRHGAAVVGWWCGLALSAALTGCAGPRYQTVSRYDPPPDAAGRVCLERCPGVLEACQDRCRVAYQTCLIDGEPEAEAHYERLLRRHETDLAGYQALAEGYGVSLGLGWGRGAGWLSSGGYGPWRGAWDHPWYGGRWYDPWHGSWHSPAPPPAMPDRSAEIRAYLQHKCGRDCGCQPEYDACFVACGGRKTVEWRCVADCTRE